MVVDWSWVVVGGREWLLGGREWPCPNREQTLGSRPALSMWAAWPSYPPLKHANCMLSLRIHDSEGEGEREDDGEGGGGGEKGAEVRARVGAGNDTRICIQLWP